MNNYGFDYDNNHSIRENMATMFENESKKYRSIAITALAYRITSKNFHIFHQHFYRAFNDKGLENLAHAIITKANK